MIVLLTLVNLYITIINTSYAVILGILIGIEN